MNDIESLITAHEGLRNKPYKCSAGKLTIGIGRNLEDLGISTSEAEYLLANDIKRVKGELRLHIPRFNILSPVRQAVLVDMCFNLGWPRMSGFRNMLTAIHQENWEKAAAEMLDSKWAKQVGKRAERLAEMMRTDEWPVRWAP